MHANDIPELAAPQPPEPQSAAAPLPPPVDVHHLRALWRAYRRAAQADRVRRREMRELRTRITPLLVAAQARLAAPGCLGGFHHWLLTHRIPRATAYSWIARHAAANPDVASPPDARPDYKIVGAYLYIRLTPRQRAVCALCLAYFVAQPKPYDLSWLAVNALTCSLVPHVARWLNSLWDIPLEMFLYPRNPAHVLPTPPVARAAPRAAPNRAPVSRYGTPART